MANTVIDLESLHKELNLSDKQKQLLSDAFEKLMAKYQPNDVREYYAGVVDGINNCFKIVNNTDDDYNSL